MDVLLQKFDYKYMKYEQELLLLEIKALFPNAVIDNRGRQLVLKHVQENDIVLLDRLTYIASYSIDHVKRFTKQYHLEQNKNKTSKRQNTRYASHGIHEYKGKFNPQIVHALFNILDLHEGDTVFDPFCGSGTTLVESAIWGYSAYGVDINPLAVQLAALKVNALSMDCAKAKAELAAAVKYLSEKTDCGHVKIESTPRNQYLLNWLPNDIFFKLERLLQYTEAIDRTVAQLFILSASNLIREYSLQEPSDLRIRRRTSPEPEIPFVDAWSKMVSQQLESISDAQQHINLSQTNGLAEVGDIRTIKGGHSLFDAAITSPPYATALPYIDTQRISLVWLGLCRPDNIMNLESTLIGSREFYHTQKKTLYNDMIQNSSALPDSVFSLITQLQQDLTAQDGFRKKAVPLLLYRYFSDMKTMFQNVCSMMKAGAKYALVVGNNKTTIGGKLNVISTPSLLAQIALNTGWNLIGLLPLQTYPRYGLHVKNSITCETLILLEKGAE